MDVFACGYCGNQQMVERKGGTVALKRVVDAIQRVQTGTDKTAAELALRRLGEELDAVRGKRSDAVAAREREIAAPPTYDNSLFWPPCLAGIIAGVLAVVITEIKGLFVLVFLPAVAWAQHVSNTVETRNKNIRARCEQTLAEIEREEGDLRERIARNRAVVDGT